MSKKKEETVDSGVYEVYTGIGFYSCEADLRNARRAMQEACSYSRGRAWVVNYNTKEVMFETMPSVKRENDEEFDIFSMDV